MEIYAVIKKNPFREHLIKVNFSNCIICIKDIHKYPDMFRIKIQKLWNEHHEAKPLQMVLVFYIL